MAYQTGAYSSREQLLDTLRLFAQAHGWIIVDWRDFRTNAGKRLSMHNGDGVYLHWYSANNEVVAPYSRDTNASYSGSNFSTIAMHFGTGHDASKDPAWQPGVPVSVATTSYFDNMVRHGFFFCQIPPSGIYHLVALPHSLSLWLDVGEANLRHIGVFKVTPFSGGAAQYLALGQNGLQSSSSDHQFHRFANGDNIYAGAGSSFSPRDTTSIKTTAGWDALFMQNTANAFASLFLSPFVSDSSGISNASFMSFAGCSGVTGVRPIAPFLIFRRQSSVLRFHGIVEHVGLVNGRDMGKAQLIETSSGQWRVFPFQTDYSSCAAIRVDL